ncbi:MAG: glycoside hydrolase family 3 N-terminal domain-containing protein [Gemmatimonadaceae bacterium]
MSEIAQLMLPAIRWDKDHGYEPLRSGIDEALELGVGGFILFGGERDAVRDMVADIRARSRIPLLIGADLERGAGQQFVGAIGLPPLAAIASLGDEEALRAAAALSAREARTLGINWIYQPVCDLDIEPENPIVGTRSLGSDPQAVAAAAVAWIDACQSCGVLACAKHFPGHGRTTTDSHAGLPVVNASAEELAKTDLVPFEAAVEAGVAAVMTAHVAFPALDSSGTPATLSRTILEEVLRGDLGFPGLIVTDALIMEGVLGGGETTAVVRALRAGCDLLLYPTNVKECIDAIDRAVASGELSREEIDLSIGRRKYWTDWANAERRPSKVTEDDAQWARQLAERVIHRVRGEPFTISATIEVIIVDDDLGGPYPPPSRQPFLDELNAEGIQAEKRDAPSGNGSNGVIVALFGDIRSWKGRPGYSAPAIDAVRAAITTSRDKKQDVIVLQFSHPRLASSIPGDAPVLCAWGGEQVMQRAAARVLAGMEKVAPPLHETGAST